jgi:hypothetical protein
MLGFVSALLYSALIVGVHFAMTGRWDRGPAFALGCVIVGALLGLLGGMVWAMSGEGPAPSALEPTNSFRADTRPRLASPAAPGTAARWSSRRPRRRVGPRRWPRRA